MMRASTAHRIAMTSCKIVEHHDLAVDLVRRIGHVRTDVSGAADNINLNLRLPPMRSGERTHRMKRRGYSDCSNPILLSDRLPLEFSHSSSPEAQNDHSGRNHENSQPFFGAEALAKKDKRENRNENEAELVHRCDLRRLA